jgi:hypothetical protein
MLGHYRNLEEELSADHFALILTLEFAQERGFDLALSYVGIDFFFSCMGVIEQATRISKSTTHPTASQRRDALREQIIKEFGIESKGAIHLSEAVQRIVTELWVRHKSDFEKLTKAYAFLSTTR